MSDMSILSSLVLPTRLGFTLATLRRQERVQDSLLSIRFVDLRGGNLIFLGGSAADLASGIDYLLQHPDPTSTSFTVGKRRIVVRLLISGPTRYLELGIEADRGYSGWMPLVIAEEVGGQAKTLSVLREKATDLVAWIKDAATAHKELGESNTITTVPASRLNYCDDKAYIGMVRPPQKRGGVFEFVRFSEKYQVIDDTKVQSVSIGNDIQSLTIRNYVPLNDLGEPDTEQDLQLAKHMVESIVEALSEIIQNPERNHRVMLTIPENCPFPNFEMTNAYVSYWKRDKFDTLTINFDDNVFNSKVTYVCDVEFLEGLKAQLVKVLESYLG